MEIIISLILSIALECNVEPYFALAIALTENSTLDSYVINENKDGTKDLGVMQLNTCWYDDEKWYEPEQNIRAGIKHIQWLLNCLEGETYWTAAIAYNAGLQWYRQKEDPPETSVIYANKVITKWRELDVKNQYKIFIE